MRDKTINSSIFKKNIPIFITIPIKNPSVGMIIKIRKEIGLSNPTRYDIRIPINHPNKKKKPSLMVIIVIINIATISIIDRIIKASFPIIPIIYNAFNITPARSEERGPIIPSSIPTLIFSNI